MSGSVPPCKVCKTQGLATKQVRAERGGPDERRAAQGGRGDGGERRGRPRDRPRVRGPRRRRRPARPRPGRARGCRRGRRAAGGRALPLEVDIADCEQVEQAAQRVEDELGPIDVWVNDAMHLGLRAASTEIDARGVPARHRGHLPRLRPRHARRAATACCRATAAPIVQVGSALAYRGIPLQSAYCGAKHAIQGFNESLRCELLHDGSRRAARRWCSCRRSTRRSSAGCSIETAAQSRSRCRRSTSPRSPPRAIVYAADHPQRREYWVRRARPSATLIANAVAPGLLDRYLARTGFTSQQTAGS